MSRHRSPLRDRAALGQPGHHRPQGQIRLLGDPRQQPRAHTAAATAAAHSLAGPQHCRSRASPALRQAEGIADDYGAPGCRVSLITPDVFVRTTVAASTMARRQAVRSATLRLTAKNLCRYGFASDRGFSGRSGSSAADAPAAGGARAEGSVRRAGTERAGSRSRRRGGETCCWRAPGSVESPERWSSVASAAHCSQRRRGGAVRAGRRRPTRPVWAQQRLSRTPVSRCARPT